MTINNRLIRFIKEHGPDIFDLLEKMVLIQSGSHNKEGVDRVSGLIESSFQSNSVSCRLIEQTKFGNHLIVRSLCEDRFDKQILLVGHMDTVFPKDTDFNSFREDSTKCYGPGVIDMKGGLVAGIFALKALDSLGLLKKIPITFIFNSDEEIGSPSSRELIKAEAKKSACAFVLECGGLKGEVVTGRKGNLSLKLNVIGKAGHAAFAGQDKASAILELAYKTIDFESLNDFEKGVTVNVGKVKGGIGPNTVPGHATANIDFRFVEQKDHRFLKEKISEIAARPKTPQTSANFEIVSKRPPMEQNEANRILFQTVKGVADKLDFPIQEEFRNGVSDANIIAEHGIPVLDGLGPAGANDHSKDEYMVKESLLQRAILLACSIFECRQKYQ
jgi:glutamate carboxypeptidase